MTMQVRLKGRAADAVREKAVKELRSHSQAANLLIEQKTTKPCACASGKGKQ